MAHVSHKLSNSLEGALAGGGDPATSPLYVFGPFLKLIVVAGVASVTFGTSIWLVVITIGLVSAMYRLVMVWVTDGSGGSGLNEEEFGPWAVKINAGITFVEYTLTFLVSTAALVTFIADRFPLLNEAVLGIQYRTILAILLSILIGWLVNRGPRMAARAFGPATAGVLALLWIMVFATILQFGLHLPKFNLQAFNLQYAGFTFGGYARILAVMTGIEVFANLVPAYQGTAPQKSRKAFGSLLIVMGTASVTMLIVGPAIMALSNPLDPEVSVFTQTMDALLPAPLAYAGTLVGVLVLMSASAASAQGLQNLALGLTERRYVPAVIGQRNRFGVADKPVWIEVGLVVAIFLLLGTHEETYLAIYAAGVFILLSMTGWAATRRLARQLRGTLSGRKLSLLVGTAVAALLTTGATLIIFYERFFEGAWTYFLFIPLLYLAFSYFRSRLGEPGPVREQLGGIEAALLGGFGFGQALKGPQELVSAEPAVPPPAQVKRLPSRRADWFTRQINFDNILVPLDGSSYAEIALPLAGHIAQYCDSRLTLVTAVPERAGYLDELAIRLREQGLDVEHTEGQGSVVEITRALVEEQDVDLVVTSTRGGSGAKHWLSGGVASKIVQAITRPVLLVQVEDGEEVQEPSLKRLLVTLDGSRTSERVMPYALTLAQAFEAEILLLMVPEVPEPDAFGASIDWVKAKRADAERFTWRYLNTVAAVIEGTCPAVRPIVTGSRPANTIVEISQAEQVDMILMATHGRGGLDRLWLGSVAERVVQDCSLPVFLLPVHNGNGAGVLAAQQPEAVEQPEAVNQPEGEATP